MNRNFLTGCLFLILAGLVGADFISTTISTDGTSLLATQGNNENGSYASRIMTVDTAAVSRSFMGGESLRSDVSVKSSGPVLVSDYASGKYIPATDTIRCVFSDWTQKPEQFSELYTSGILSKGNFTASRAAGDGLTGGIETNGTGMMSFGSQNVGGTFMRSSGFVSGNMTLQDFVKYGGKL